MKFQVVTFLLFPVFLFTGVAIAFQDSKRFLATKPIQSFSCSSSKLQFHWSDDTAIAAAASAAVETIDPTAPMETSANVNSLLLVSTTTTTSLLSKAITTTTTTTTPELLESEVLLDFSHLFLDFSVFVTENKPILNVAQVIGRILVLAQDYLPDKHISPEELGIQVLMIATCLAKQQSGSGSGSGNGQQLGAAATAAAVTNKTNSIGNETHTETPIE